MDESWQYAVGVGANIGDRNHTIAHAVCLLNATGLARVVAQAPVIETQPVGGPMDQPPFLNGAWIVASSLGAHQFLNVLQRIEIACGRVRTVAWGPRTLDLDLLLRDDGVCVQTPILQVPHPRLAERPFVLTPLAEIAADWLHPITGTTIGAMAKSIGQNVK